MDGRLAGGTFESTMAPGFIWGKKGWRSLEGPAERKAKETRHFGKLVPFFFMVSL